MEDRTFILSSIWTSENSASIKDEKLYSLAPLCAGTLEAIEVQLKHFIKNAEAEGRSVEEITSKDVHAGQYFDKVVKIQNKIGGPSIFGIHSVWSV